MQVNSRFDLKRFWLLIKNDLLTNYRTILITAGAAIGILLFINMVAMLTNGEAVVPLAFYLLMLFIGGFIVTSQSFNDLHHSQRSYVYLTLPASNLEKFLSKLVLTTIGYVTGTLILYFLFSVLMSVLNALLFGYGYPLFNPFDRVVWICIGIYIITQSIFLLGAVYYKKQAFIKTNLFLFLLQLAVSIFIVFLVKIVFWNYIQGWSFSPEDIILPSSALEDQLENFFMGFARLMKLIFYWLFAPFLWLITYFRLKETEA